MLAERVQIDSASHLAGRRVVVFHFAVVRAFAEVGFLVVRPLVDVAVGRRLLRAGVAPADVVAGVRAAMVLQRDQLVMRHLVRRVHLEDGPQLVGCHPFVNLAGWGSELFMNIRRYCLVIYGDY